MNPKKRESEFRVTNRGAGFQITFTNLYTISVQFGVAHYCSHHNSCDFEKHVRAHAAGESWTSPDAEIAILGPDGEWATKQFIPDCGDDVEGYLNPNQVGALIAQVMAK